MNMIEFFVCFGVMKCVRKALILYLNPIFENTGTCGTYPRWFEMDRLLEQS
jgi:hypothetical protein